MKHIIYFLFLILMVQQSFSQLNLSDQFRLAESYEKGGDIKNAARIYKELYDSNPNSQEYFAAMVRTYNSLARYTDLRDILQARMKFDKGYMTYSLYGEALWKTGNSQDAVKIWEEGLDRHKGTYEIYIAISEAQSRLRLFDKAITTLLLGRKKIDIPAVFSNELSQLYIATGNYQDGTDEILNYFYEHQQISFAQGRLHALMISQKSSEYIINRLKQEADSHDGDVLVQELYAYFLRTIGNFDEALRVTIRIDNLKKAEGREIYYFAERSRQDDQFDIALKAYENLIKQGRKNRLFNSALLGYAKTLESKLISESKFSKLEIQGVINRYREIIEEEEHSPEAQNSRYQIALLYYKYLNDNSNALNEVNKLLKGRYNNILMAMAGNLKGDIYLSQDKLDEAAESYKYSKMLLSSNPTVSYFDYAEYKIAEIEYFKGNIDSSKVMFQDIANKTISDDANDALEKITLLEKNKQFTGALQTFSKAQLRETQARYQEAKELYLQAANQAPGEDISEYATVLASNIDLITANYPSLRQNLEKLLTANPETIYGDWCYYLIARSYLAEKNKDAAIQNFTNILVRYPRSTYVQEARKSIRELREDKI